MGNNGVARTNYNDQYWVVFRISEFDDEEIIFLKATGKSAKSGYGWQRLKPNGPLYFENGFAEEYGPGKLQEKITDVMFDGNTGLVVTEKIKNFLETFDINGLQLYPAIYIDVNGDHHKNLWLLNFYQHLDCWDREKSEVKEYKHNIVIEGEKSKPRIVKFYLNPDILDHIPEEQRLIIRMSGLDRGYVLFHKRVVDFFEQIQASGIWMIPVNDYKGAMENFSKDDLP